MTIARNSARPSRRGTATRLRRGVRCAIVVGLFASGVAGQTNDEVHAGQQFNLAPPGARSLAMGGAFSGLADDATAAFANPAGLLWLRKPEVSLELRSTRLHTRFPDQGSASGAPSLCTGTTDPDCVDRLADLQLGEASLSTDNLAFFSYVHLFKRAARDGGDQTPPYLERWRVALFRHQLADYRSAIRSRGPFLGGAGTRRALRTRLAAVDAEYDLEVITTGVAVARELARGARYRLWGGLSLGWSALDLESTTRRYRNIESSEGFPALTVPADFSTGNETNRQTQRGNDGAVSGSAGLIVRPESARWSVGLVYRRAPEFDIDYRFRWGVEARQRALDTGNPDAADPALEEALSGSSTLAIPDVWSLGGSIRLGRRARASIDYTRVRYSSLLPRDNVLLNLVSPANCGEFSAGGSTFLPPVPCGVNAQRFARFEIDDADEIHLGLEYVAGRRNKVAFRLGGWLDPDHQLRFNVDDQLHNGFGESAIANSIPPLDRLATRFLAGEDEIHVTGGIGLVPARRGWQVDLAADVSDRADIFSLSVVYRW